jgi:uncharacterized protein YeaO (DUF488 family)
MTTVRIKCVYEDPKEEDGVRILVDRIWPKGVKEEVAWIDMWLRDIGPSSDLSKCFGHDSDRWPEFKARYIEELRSKNQELSVIIRAASAGPMTLIYAASDESHKQAMVLQEVIGRL